MRRVIRKLFFVWQFDKEEKWLNEMAAKGLCLVSSGFCKYEFEDCDPGEYKICLQLLEKKLSHPESQKYIEFIESTGAEHVGTFSRWVYFRKKTSEGDFEIYSDNASRIKYLSRVIGVIALIVVSNLLIGIYNLFLAFCWDSQVNYLGFLNLAIGIFGTFGVLSLMKKKRQMKRESQLFE